MGRSIRGSAHSTSWWAGDGQFQASQAALDMVRRWITEGFVGRWVRQVRWLVPPPGMQAGEEIIHRGATSMTAREQIGRISADLRTAIEKYAKASWVRADRMHLTLQFFAAADSTSNSASSPRWHLQSRNRRSMCRSTGVGFFPEQWIASRLVAGHSTRRRRAAMSASDPSRPPGGALDAFTPHLTLARLRNRVSRSKLAQIAGIPASAGPCTDRSCYPA